jgi:hypothetical protein
LFGPVRERIIQALGDQDRAVRDALLQLRGVIDAVRADLQNDGPAPDKPDGPTRS